MGSLIKKYIMKTFFFLIFPLFLNAQYKITTKKILTWSAFGIAGSIYGAREAYHANPYCFEQKWRVGEYSFWGSKQWERNYIGNRYTNESGFPNKHKTEIFGNFGRDYWHTSGYVSGTLVVGSTFTIGMSKQKIKHKLLDLLIGSSCFIISSNLTFKHFR